MRVDIATTRIYNVWEADILSSRVWGREMNQKLGAAYRGSIEPVHSIQEATWHVCQGRDQFSNATK